MLKLLLTQLEQFLNHAIQTDEDALAHLRRLAGKILVVRQEYSITFQPQYLKICMGTDQDIVPDIIVTGPPQAFLSLLLTKDPLLASKQGLAFTDNAGVVQSVQALFLHLDIDWEEHVANFIGDIAAHELCKLARKTLTEGKIISNNFSEMVSEYLLEEQRLSPTTKELDNFAHEVAELRSYIARLEARYDLLAVGKTT